MLVGVIPFTWGSGAAGGGGGPTPGAGAEEHWIHPIYSRGERVKALGQRNQRGIFVGRVRDDDEPDFDTFFDE